MSISAVMRLVGLLLLGIFINGCATLGKDECLTANWETIGYEDGTRGLEASRIGKHRSACAKHSVTPDLERYTQGREHGLEEYCKSSVGYNVGVRGGRYLNVCPAYSERDFLAGYRYGQDIYKTQSQLRSLKNKLKSKATALDDLIQEMELKEEELIQTGVSPLRRAKLLEELISLSAKIEDYEAMIADLYDQIDEADTELSYLQAHNPYQ
jgi:hypothetical protein